MTLEEQVREILNETGFEAIGACPASEVKARPEVRDMCAADKCQSYDRNWCCPPAVGPVEKWQEVFDQGEQFIVAQTIVDKEDDFDFEAIMEGGKLNRERFQQVAEKIQEAGLPAKVFSSGTCMNCKECTYPDAPCRFPDKQQVSVEAAGLIVSELCTLADIPYNYGTYQMAFTGAVLI